MIHISNIFSSVFFVVGFSSLCTCPPPKNWKKATPIEYKYVNDVFIGDIRIDCDNDFEYLIVICEVFKGDLQPGQIIKGINSGTCGPYVDTDGEWILFGNYSSRFIVNDCGLSLNIINPKRLLAPQPINLKNNLESRRLEAKQNIKQQINMLREMIK